MAALQAIPKLTVDDEAGILAKSLIVEGGIPAEAEADALHVAIAATHRMDYLLTWNCRHINNASKKPIIRSICIDKGYNYPEICTPLELLPE